MNRHARRVRAALTLAALTLGALSATAPLAVASTAVPAYKVPFTDANVDGWLTFCNQKDQPVTSGNIYAQPFAWKTISSGEAPAGYRKSTARATLYAYQPLQYIDPGDWSGAQLTAGSVYSNADHPVSAATAVDVPLVNFVQAYPPHWEGLVEIRMMFSGVDEEQLMTPYAAAVLRITGSTWTLVEGGGGSCSQGNGISMETAALPKKDLKAKQDAAHPAKAPAPGSSRSTSTGSGSSASGTGTGGQSSTASGARLASADSSSGISVAALAGIAVGVLALVWLAITMIGRRRRATNT
jgi:hypothetical protein